MIPRREIPLTPAPMWESMIKVLSPLDKNSVKRKKNEKKTYSLPEDADLQTINAKVNDGILTITIKTKTEKTKGREIEIRW